jgi:RNA recognition motif-containing protein
MQFFVSNIPYQYTAEDFDAFIKTIIPTATTRLMVFNDKSAQPRLGAKKNKGYGFITVEDKDVETVKTSDKFVIETRRLTFTEYVNQQKLYKLHVTKIPENITEKDLFEVFSVYGKLDCVAFDKDKNTGLGRGSGVVVYSNYEDFHKVLEMKVVVVDGKELEISKRRLFKRPFVNRPKFVPNKLGRPLEIKRANQ